jgi:hypothetical protein
LQVARHRRIITRRYLIGDHAWVAVEVEMVIPESDPSEPCLESEAVELLREVHVHAVDSYHLASAGVDCAAAITRFG